MNSPYIATATIPALIPCPAAPKLSLKAQRMVLRIVLILMDACALGLAFRICYWIRFDLRFALYPDVIPSASFYPHLVEVLIPLFVAVFGLFGLYRTHVLLGGVMEYSRVFHACTTATMVIILVEFARPDFVVSRIWLIGAWLLSFFLVAASRLACRRLAYSARERGYLLVRAVIVGTNEEAATLAEDLQDWRASGLRIAGFVGSKGSRRFAGLPVLGTVNEIRNVIEEQEIEDIIVAITALSREQLLYLCEEVNAMKNVHLRLSSGLYELLTTGVTVRSLGNVPLVSLRKFRLAPVQTCMKAVLEYSLTAIALVLFSPVLLLIAILIKLDSRGPAIYRRRVLGVSGKTFDAFKFRTMYIDGDRLLKARPDLAEELRNNHKLKDDPRITRIGRLLRKCSLDELPQLFNVIMGQMSLVGPRMITAAEAEKYGRHRLNLLTVKPGITGFWQVNGRSDVSYDERVNLDMYYIRNYSVWLDLQILFFQTIPAVIKGRGAY
jgi:exopolysaccharide biosynthesis polyprenyl glycosylphosphotransferase